MTVATMTDSSAAPSATSYDAHHVKTLSHLRPTPTRAVLQIFTLGASVILLASTAVRLTPADARLFYAYSVALLVISAVPALIVLFFGENAASRELAERYAGLTGADIWRAHTISARQILAMSVPYALICAGCELIIAGGHAEPANIWSTFSAPVRWAPLPVVITLSYYLGATMGAIELRHPILSAIVKIFLLATFDIGILAYGLPRAALTLEGLAPSSGPLSVPSLTTFSVQFIAVTLILGAITCRQLTLRTPPLR